MWLGSGARRGGIDGARVFAGSVVTLSKQGGQTAKSPISRVLVEALVSELAHGKRGDLHGEIQLLCVWQFAVCSPVLLDRETELPLELSLLHLTSRRKPR
jgi:hypothetical protein